MAGGILCCRAMRLPWVFGLTALLSAGRLSIVKIEIVQAAGIGGGVFVTAGLGRGCDAILWSSWPVLTG